MPVNAAIIPPHLNPILSPEQEQEVRFFQKWGYLVVEQALSDEQVETLRSALDQTFTRTGTQFTHQLLEEDDRFSFLLDNPPVLARMKALLGNCVQLHSATARVTQPGAPDQSWHRDGPWPMDPEGTPYGSVPGQINCGYYLDALTMENGPIVIVPGSHRVPFRPPAGHPTFPDERFILATPGQAVLFDGWLYHRG
ncbi:MAG TPA: phytanoyl-CoA dioxygenase family protein, partial [Chloroflexota bacterium]|nr:phytanoyl-CoA dioxygenase family protein [Chloroflexota bacterium]